MSPRSGFRVLALLIGMIAYSATTLAEDQFFPASANSRTIEPPVIQDSVLEAVPAEILESPGVKAAEQQYLDEIAAIEAWAAAEHARIDAEVESQRSAATMRHLEALLALDEARHIPGLVGPSTMNGETAPFVFEYQHGWMFDRELVWERFHDGNSGPFPSVTITLEGFVDVPNDMTVFIRHAGGGVNHDWAELFIDDHSFGVLGDDHAKRMIYVVVLSQGTHRIRWELTAGTFQHCMLSIEDPKTGERLEVYHTPRERSRCGYDAAREVVAADDSLETWPFIDRATDWNWMPVAEWDQ